MSSALDLDSLIDEWRGPLVGLLLARGVTRGEADDLAQEVFAEAWCSVGRFRGSLEDTRDVGAWLAGIARNLHRSRMRQPPIRLVPLEDAGQEPARDLDAPDPATESGVLAAIRRLPDAEREAVQSFYLEVSDTKHVAALLGITERAVEGLLYRARKRLRTWLSEPREEDRRA